jgi:hypothetical protein
LIDLAKQYIRRNTVARQELRESRGCPFVRTH